MLERSSTRWALLAVAFAGYLAVATYPFELDAPTRFANGAVRDTDGDLHFPSHGIAVLSAPSWASAAVDGEDLDLEVVAEPSQAQSGPARIVTLSQDTRHANLTVGQQGDDLVIRLRREGSDPLGNPAFVIPGALAPGETVEVAVEITGQRLTVAVDGRPMIDADLGPGRLSSWDPDFPLAIGNEHGGGRPWLGTVSVVTATTADARNDVLRDPDLEVPDFWWRLPNGWADLRAGGDGSEPGVLSGAWHVLGFAVIGWLVRGVLRRTSARLLLIGLMSVGVLVAKVFAAGRHPSTFDALVQMTGGAAGLGVAEGWWRRRTPPVSADSG